MGGDYKIAKGIVWTGIEAFVNRFFSFVIKLFLARILYPEDFGIVGMATVFTALIQVFNDLGMGSALVQRRKEDLNMAHFHTAFWTGVAWSLVVYLLVSFVVAPFTAWFYSEPLLKYIIPVLSLGILASPMSLVPVAKLTRDFNFKRLAIINNSSSIFSGLLALALAYFGAGVWSLVFNSVAIFLIAVPQYYRAIDWRPRMVWNKKCFADIFGFGVLSTGTQVFNKITSQIDYLLIGKIMGAASLGVYSFALVVTEAFREQVMGVLNKVMYPFYSELQNDVAKLRYYYLRVVRASAMVIYPAMVFLVVFADALVVGFFGEKWIESIPIIRILAGSVMIHMLVNSNTSLIRAFGKPGLELRIQVAKSVFFFVPLISVGTLYYGVVGTAIGYTVAKVLAVGLSLFVTRRLFNLPITAILRAAMLPMLIAAVPGIISWLVRDLSDSWVLGLLTFIVCYFTLFFSLAKEEVKLLRKIIGKKDVKAIFE